jgi:hypothetical protein
VEVELSVRVPDGSPEVYLAGNADELGPWAADGLLLEGAGPVRTGRVAVPRGETFEFKFTLGSWDREGLGPSGMVMPNFRMIPTSDTAAEYMVTDWKKDPEVYMADVEGARVLGTLIYWPGVESRFLEPARHVSVWLPPGYEAEPDRRWPVLYMHDGQNLFDPRIANTGTDWGVDEAMVAGAEAGRFEPAIVVATWSTARRAQEYSPWHEADRFARFLTEEIMPRVNAEFRTLTGPENTFVMGSSMGGLLSWYLVTEHPDIFGACGCVSTHVPFSEVSMARMTGSTEPGDDTPLILRDLEGDRVPPGLEPGRVRIFFDWGTRGLDADYAPIHARMADRLRRLGLVEGRDFLMREYAGADHNETSWRARVGDQLEWILGRRIPAP